MAGVDNRKTLSSNRNHTLLERAVEKAEKKVSSVTKAVQQTVQIRLDHSSQIFSVMRRVHCSFHRWNLVTADGWNVVSNCDAKS